MRQFGLIFLLSTVSVVSAGTCGGSGIPFRFEVLPSGTPVLGCATPQCFGGDDGGRNILHDSKFNAGPDGEDGFFRDGDHQRIRTRFRDSPAQQADCPVSLDSRSCNNPLTWVGGFVAAPDGSLRLQCCHYSGLRFGAEVGKPIVHAGEVYSGGEVLRDNRQTGFDLISNVRKIESSDGSISYELTVTRMNCLPDPPEAVNDVSVDSQNDISRILDKVGEVQQSPEQTQLSGNSISNAAGDENYEKDSQVADQVGDTGYVTPPSADPSIPGAPIDQYVQVGEQVIPVTQAGYYYPVASGIPACFTGDTLIDTPNGKIRMDQLKIGDLVLTSENNGYSFTPVKSFLHRLPKVVASFIRLETEREHLKLTPQHYIYKVSCNDSTITDLVYAENLQVGDCIFEAAYDEDEALHISQILSKTAVRERGVFAPMTGTGDLFVNNILASCHNVVRMNTLAQTFLEMATNFQEKLKYWLGDSEGHLPATAEFFLQAVHHIIPGKV